MRTHNFVMIFLLLLLSLFFVTPISLTASVQSPNTVVLSQGIVTYGGSSVMVLNTSFENVVTQHTNPGLNPINLTAYLQTSAEISSTGNYWIEGREVHTSGAPAAHTGKYSLGLNATGSQSSFRSQIDYGIYPTGGGKGPLANNITYYVSMWEYLPSTFLTNFNYSGASAYRWFVIGGDPYQDDVPNVGFFPQLEIHLWANNGWAPGHYALEMTERTAAGIIQVADINPFNASIFVGKWFNVAWYVHEDSSTTLNSTGNIIPNGDSQITVWINGVQEFNVVGSQFLYGPLPRNGLTGYLGSSGANSVYTTIGKVYGGDSSMGGTIDEWVDDVQIWTGIPTAS